jgi:hypothetical protein
MTKTDDAAALLGELDEAAALRELTSAGKPTDAPEIIPREKVIGIHYRCGDGEVLEGALTFSVPSVRQERVIEARKAQLCGGIPPITEAGMYLIEQIAYLEVCTANRPKWMAEVQDIPDPALLGALYREAREHHARFRGAARDLRPGAGDAQR